MESLTQMASYTPAPWVARQKPDLNKIWYVERDRESRWPHEIAVIYPGTLTSDEREENARLIAAAPELLDAVNGLLGLVQLLESGRPELRASMSHRYLDAKALVERLGRVPEQPRLLEALLKGSNG